MGSNLGSLVIPFFNIKSLQINTEQRKPILFQNLDSTEADSSFSGKLILFKGMPIKLITRYKDDYRTIIGTREIIEIRIGQMLVKYAESGGELSLAFLKNSLTDYLNYQNQEKNRALNILGHDVESWTNRNHSIAYFRRIPHSAVFNHPERWNGPPVILDNDQIRNPYQVLYSTQDDPVLPANWKENRYGYVHDYITASFQFFGPDKHEIDPNWPPNIKRIQGSWARRYVPVEGLIANVHYNPRYDTTSKQAVSARDLLANIKKFDISGVGRALNYDTILQDWKYQESIPRDILDNHGRKTHTRIHVMYSGVVDIR